MITPDRHTAPPIGLPEEIKISPAETQQLSNGTPLYLINAGTQDVVKVELIFAAGNIASSQISPLRQPCSPPLPTTCSTKEHPVIIAQN